MIKVFLIPPLSGSVSTAMYFPFSHSQIWKCKTSTPTQDLRITKQNALSAMGKSKEILATKTASNGQAPSHIKCSTKSTDDWTCPKCLLSELPFHKATNDDFLSNLLGLDDSCREFLKNIPSFKNIGLLYCRQSCEE